MDTVPLALAELSKEDAIATVREALDSVGLLDNSGWPADRPCFGPCPPSRTISCGITTDTCYVISHHQLMIEPLISPWSGVQLSPLAPDHALLAAACPPTRKSAPSCDRSASKTAARPERRVFPRECRRDRVSGCPTRWCPDGRTGEPDEVSPASLEREGVHGEAATVSLPCSGLPPVQFHHRAGPGCPVHGGDRPGRDCSDADEVPSGSRDRGLQLSRPSSNRVFRGHILSSPTR